MSQDKPLIPNEKLKREREKRGWSQEEVAKRIEVQDTSTVSDWETGKHRPSLHFRTKLCKLFEMNADELGLTKQKAIVTEEERCETSEEFDNVTVQDGKMASLCTDSPSQQPPVSDPQDKIQLPDQEAEHVLNGETSHNDHITPPYSHQRLQPPHSWVRQVGPIGFALLISFAMAAYFFLSRPISFQSTQSDIHSFSITHGPITPTTPSTIHQEQEKCTLSSNETGYLKIVTKRGSKEEVLCFSGTGTLDVSIEYVQKVETGNLQANWTYLSIDGKEHISPTSADPDLYWCPGNSRTYDHLISIEKITIASPSPEKRCADRTFSI
jgi:transcriptional regulator with XRE-family HTH domain